jgi:hypothetical protein
MAKCRWCYDEGSLGRRIDREKTLPIAKNGVKRSPMTDADGIPVGLAVNQANVH